MNSMELMRRAVSVALEQNEHVLAGTRLEFGEPREQETKRGPRILASATPTSEFWDAWKQKKTAMKKAGLSVSKWGDTWQVSIWIDPDELLEKAKDKLNGFKQDLKDIGIDEKEIERACLPKITFEPEEFVAGNMKAVEAQQHGVERIVAHCTAGNDAFLLADQMGSGKTLQAMLAYRALKKRGHVVRLLVMCPASLCSMWAEKLQALDVRPQWLQKGTDKIAEDTEAVICNYSLAIREKIEPQLRAWMDMLDTDKPAMMILDEADKTKGTGWKPPQIAKLVWGLGGKTKERKRYNECYIGLANMAGYTLLLTGTPTPNGRASELHGFMTVAANCPLAYHKYATRFCGLRQIFVRSRKKYFSEGASHGGYVWKETENTDTDEWQRLIEPHRLQRPVSAFADLPPISHTHHTTRASKQLLKQIADTLDDEAHEKICKAVECGLEPAFEEFATVMRLIGLAKVSMTVDLACDLAAHEPLVLFVKHNEVLDQVCEGVAKKFEIIRMDASMNGQKRGDAVARFQSGEARVFITTLGVAAEGITLTRASQTLIAEMDYIPGRLDQACARIHRIGQDKHCTIHRIGMQDTIDDALLNMTLAKRDNISELAGEKDE